MIEGREEQVSREAWAYAPRYNGGISLRVDNELKYILNDAAWIPEAANDERLFALASDPGESEDIAPMHPDRATLRRAAERRLLRRRSAVAIEIDNPTNTLFAATLSGRDVRLSTLKTLGEPCHCVHHLAPNSARLEVPAGRALRLVLDGPHSGPLTVVAGDQMEGLTIPAGQLGAWSWRAAEGWESPADGGVRLTARSLGAQPESSAAPGLLRAELREQMQALGYVD